MGNSRQGRLDKASARLDMDGLVLARPSCLGSSWQIWSRLGRVRRGVSWPSWRGRVAPSGSRRGRSWPSRLVRAWPDRTGRGAAWPSQRGLAWSVRTWIGRLGRADPACRHSARSGRRGGLGRGWVRQGKTRPSSSGVLLGKAGRVGAWPGRRSAARLVGSWRGTAGFGGRVQARSAGRGASGLGSVGRGWARSRQGPARPSWRGLACHGRARQDKAWPSRRGLARQVASRSGRPGMACPGATRPVLAVLARSVRACPGRVRPSRRGRPWYGLVGPDSACKGRQSRKLRERIGGLFDGNRRHHRNAPAALFV